MKEKLVAIYNTLNQIEVKGDHNISRMYGIMEIIKQMVNETDETQTEE